MKTRRVLAIVLATSLILALTPVASQAGTITSLSDTMSRHATSTASNHTIQFTVASAVDPGDTITITFPSGFDLTAGSGITFNDVDVKDDGTDLTLAATPGTGAGSALGVGVSGQVITITENDTDSIAAGSVVEVQIGTNATYGVSGDDQITNPSSANTYKISIAGTLGDTGSLAVNVGADQVTVQCVIDPTITMTVNDTSVDLGTLSTSSVSTDTTNFDVSTNGTSGYTTTITEDGNLRDGSNDVDDVSDGTVTAGSEEYGASTSKSSQTITQTSGNNATGLDGTNKSCASGSSPVSSDNTVLTFHASITGTTPAGSYSHTCTLIATGNF